MQAVVMGVAHDADLRSLTERSLELPKALGFGLWLVHVSPTVQCREEAAWSRRLVE